MNNINQNNNDDLKHSLWDDCLLYIKERLPSQAFQTWFSSVSLSRLKEEEIILQVPNKFHYEWLESKYRILIDDAVKTIFETPLIVNYSIVISDKSSQEIPTIKTKISSIPKPYYNQSQLNKSYTFDTFIEGNGNQFARAAGLSVADNPGIKPFNPLLVYSNTGLGKTHLLQAIGNFVLSKNPKLKIMYLTSNQFLNDFISSIQKNESINFNNKYRKADILLLDDIQFFQNKTQTQEQFFHLFNDLYQRGKQIVLTTDRHPSSLVGLEKRLISRFKGSLIADIQPPNLETRIAILRNLSDFNRLEIPNNIAEYIATCITSDVRALKRALQKMMAVATLLQKDINMSLARQVVKEMIGNDSFEEISIEEIIKYVSKDTGISQKLICGKSRKKEIALARQITMYLSRELTDLSLFNIGTFLGKRDHSTVIHACKTIDIKLKKESVFKKNIVKLKKEINQIKIIS